MMYQAGFPDPEPPVRAQPWTADYISGFCALSATLACIMNARATGQGQAIDVAMFEVIHKIIGPTMLEYFETGLIRERVGNRATAIQPLDTFRAKDGWLMIACALISHGDKICTMLGLDPQPGEVERNHLQSGYARRMGAGRTVPRLGGRSHL